MTANMRRTTSTKHRRNKKTHVETSNAVLTCEVMLVRGELKTIGI